MHAAIVGAGQTPFGEHPDLSVKELFAASLGEMTRSIDRRWDPDRLEAAFIGSLSCGQGMQLGNFAPALVDYTGLPPVPALHVENACASGGFALRQAVQAVASGQARCVLAAGVEKMRDVSGEKGRYWLGISGDTEYERLAGLTFAGVFALIADRLIHDGAVQREDLARVAVKNRRHGAMNPKAMFRREITVEQVLQSSMVAAPLTGYDCCPTSDGAAAVLVVAPDLAREFTGEPVWVAGWGASSDKLALHSRRSIARLEAARQAARQAYAMAGLGPDQIDLAEVHDCFTIAELVAYQELGFCDITEAGRRLEEGEFSLGGRLPVNPSGGLNAKGHPIAATGVSQAVEAFHQLRGDAREPLRQVKGAKTALAYNMGGSGASATVHIFRRGG